METETQEACSNCGYALHTFWDESTLCPLCYVHGEEEAPKIAARLNEAVSV